MNTKFEQKLQKSKNKESTRRGLVLIVFFLVLFSFQTLMFQTSVHCFFFFLFCHALKTWFELSRVESYRNDLTGSKNYFELAGGLSSSRRFDLPRRQKRGGLIEDLRYLITLAVLNGAVT